MLSISGSVCQIHYHRNKFWDRPEDRCFKYTQVTVVRVKFATANTIPFEKHIYYSRFTLDQPEGRCLFSIVTKNCLSES